jgi:hypothetical protein
MAEDKKEPKPVQISTAAGAVAEAQRLLRIAQESLQQYGTVLPSVREALVEYLATPSGMPAVEARPEAPSGETQPAPKPGPQRAWTPDPKWKTIQHRCPVCRQTKFVDPDFGVRLLKGVQKRQSYCRQCRNRLDYHHRNKT